jgi:hypothetical protein
MQTLAVMSSKQVALYRVVYRSKESGTVVRTEELHNLKAAQQIVKSFNARYGEDFEYFVEEVSLNSLSKQTLLRLVEESKLTMKQALPYLGTNPLG